MSGHGSVQQSSAAAARRRDELEHELLELEVVSSTSIFFKDDAAFQAAIPAPEPKVSPVPVAEPVKAPSRSRQSKVQALAKLNGGQSHEVKVEAAPVVVPPFMPAPSENAVRKALARDLAPPLDMDSLSTKAPSDFPTRSGEARPFGLQHCPVFRPTPDEFAKPMEYLEKVAQQATGFGIAKVIPPDGWKPPFSLNSEVGLCKFPGGKMSHTPARVQTFHFKTRLQRLNSMEASARANINFMEQLFVFHRQQPGPRVTIPVIEDKPVDMWRLRKAVKELGGYTDVCRERKWPVVAKMLGFEPKADAINELKTAYAKIIIPFDRHMDQIRINAVVPSAVAREREEGDPTLGMSSRMGAIPSTSAAVSTSQLQEASAKLNRALNADPEGALEGVGRRSMT
jgi:hypothetical protein